MGTSLSGVVSTVMAVCMVREAAEAQRLRVRPSTGEVVPSVEPCGKYVEARARKIALRSPVIEVNAKALAVDGAGYADAFRVETVANAETCFGVWDRSSDERVELTIGAAVRIVVRSAITTYRVVRLTVVKHPTSTAECRETWVGLAEVLP